MVPVQHGHSMTITGAVNGVKAKKKGVEIPNKIAVIDFVGTDYEGGEARAKLNVNLAYFSEIQKATSENDSIRMAELFGDLALISWNFETDEGEPIPATAEGMKQIPVELVNLLVGTWAEKLVSLDDPLEDRFGALSTLAAASTVTET